MIESTASLVQTINEGRSQLDGTASGTISGLGSSVSLAVPNGSTASNIQLTGDFYGTVQFESSVDGGTNYNPRVYRSTGILNNLKLQTSTFPSEWRGNVGGMSHVRVRCVDYTSGSLFASIRTGQGPAAVFLNAAIPIGGQSATNNASGVVLGPGQSYVGKYEDLENVASISINSRLTQSGTLSLVYSLDGASVFDTVSFSMQSGVPFVLHAPPRSQFLLVKATNGSNESGTLDLDVLYRASSVTDLKGPLNQQITDTTTASLHRSVISARKKSGQYVNIGASEEGDLLTSFRREFYTGVVSGLGIVEGLDNIDALAYGSAEVHSIGTFGQFDMTLQVEGSDSPLAGPGQGATVSGWHALTLHSDSTGARSTSFKNASRFHINGLPRKMRVRCTRYVSGILPVNLTFRAIPQESPARYVSDPDGLSRWGMSLFGGAGIVTQKTFMCGGNFDAGSLDSSTWTDISQHGGSHVFGSGMLALHTGTSTSGAAGVRSIHRAEFIGGSDTDIFITARQADTGGSGYVYRFGLYDDKDGAFVEVNASGVTFKSRKNGIDTESAFGILGIVHPSNTTGFQFWRILFNPNLILFYQGSNLVQLLAGSALLNTLFARYDLPVSAEAINTGSSGNHTLFVQSMVANRLGLPNTVRAGDSFKSTDILSASAAVIQGSTSSGTFSPVGITPRANLRVSSEEIGESQRDKLIAADRSVFGSAFTEGMFDDIRVRFDIGVPENIVLTETSGNGSISTSNSQAVLSAGPASGSLARISSRDAISYKPGHEIRADFTAVFSSPLSGCRQHIGLFDLSNGYFVGYSGTTFGFFHRTNGVTSIHPRSTWNKDTLEGSSQSLFTRNGTPEILDPSKSNVYRIRFGWLGSAPVLLDVLSPDNDWVGCHEIKHPNTLIEPEIRSPDLPIRIVVANDSNPSGTVTVKSSSWRAGTMNSAREAKISTINSTTTALGVSGTFVGIFEDVLAFTSISTTVVANTDSSVSGLRLEFSDNGSTILKTIPFEIFGSSEDQPFVLPRISRYYRVRYTNGPNAHSVSGFRITTIYSPTILQPPIGSIGDPLSDESLVGQVRAVVVGRTDTGSGYSNADVHKDGAGTSLAVSPGHRISQVFNRSHHEVVGENLSSNALLYTVPSSKRFQMTGLHYGMTNSSTTAAGRVILYDGVSGVRKIPFLMQEATSQSKGIVAGDWDLSEPVAFSSGVYLAFSGGTCIASLMMVGYLESSL